ncbi:ribonuclease P protein component [Microbacterium sp. LRZ72]|uniref:ribonuclease P protein component n=1 Tax=Microbacterium sp. LRZ72 TaxID=2942481 RepID=UPI0029A08DA3|nr:ribonuclease P protein component [Microbacterium sp. LRZ72]MDX2376235.1 ribonuclease P protein component [Microbacterium sp. LRZ72]
MLSRANRLTRGDDYRHVVRRGRRCAGGVLVTHVVPHGGDDVRFGFIVAKSVGTAVTRNTVRRRLKAACRDLLPAMEKGRDVVIRALPPAATADYATLHAQVQRCLERTR